MAIETQLVELTALARQMDEAAAVEGGYGTADRASVDAFIAWESAHVIEREQFAALVASQGVDDWRDLPTHRGHLRVYAESEQGGGGERIDWWKLPDGRFLGRATTQCYWLIGAGEEIPIIADYAEYTEDDEA